MWANDTASAKRAVAVGVVAGLAVLARVDVALLVAVLALLQVWRGPRRLLLPGAIAGAVVVAPWWIWCTIQFGTPVPTSGSAAHDLATVRPFAREGLAQVAGAVAGGPFDVWRSLRDWLNDHPVAGMAVFWLFVVALVALGVLWALRRVMPQLAVAALPVFAAGLLLFYAWFGVGFYFTRYLAPVACVVSLIIAVGVEHVWRARGAWRVPLFVGTAVVLLVGFVAVVRATHRNLTDTEVPPLSFDTVTGYRDAAMAVVQIPPEGSVLGAYQSGAFGYYANGRLEVVNLDGVVNSDAHDALRNGTIVRYMHDRGVDWLSDFGLHIVGFVVESEKVVHPPPTVVGVKGLPQYPPFPGYALAEIRWPPKPEIDASD
jgi:hypothetical protein